MLPQPKLGDGLRAGAGCLQGLAVNAGSHPWPEALSYQERMDIARLALKRYGAKLRRKQNVVSVGVGLKHVRVRKGSKSIRVLTFDRHRLHLHDEFVPCVSVNVRKKWSTRRPNHPDALPESLPMRVPVGKGRLRINVPVDVLEYAAPELHSWACSATCGSLQANGTAACLVSYANAGPYLLSCHHVLALSEQQPISPPPSQVSVGYQGGASTSGVVLPSSPWGCDAAIAHSPSPVWTPDSIVKQLTGVLPGGQDPPGIYYALTRRGRVQVSFLQDQASFTQDGYFNGNSVTFPRVILSNGDSEFQEEDSGSLLATADGVLVAMHFAGVSATSYAVPMADVMNGFPKMMMLWRP
jgi:hypothetical protein